jgi:hypothetical protein
LLCSRLAIFAEQDPSLGIVGGWHGCAAGRGRGEEWMVRLWVAALLTFGVDVVGLGQGDQGLA